MTKNCRSVVIIRDSNPMYTVIVLVNGFSSNLPVRLRPMESPPPHFQIRDNHLPARPRLERSSPRASTANWTTFLTRQRLAGPCPRPTGQGSTFRAVLAGQCPNLTFPLLQKGMYRQRHEREEHTLLRVMLISICEQPVDGAVSSE